jgi:stage III sporulation protein SpoIIIAA
MLSELYGIYAVRYVQQRGYNIPVVRERLTLAAERVLGEGRVKTVRLQDITKRVPSSG